MDRGCSVRTFSLGTPSACTKAFCRCGSWAQAMMQRKAQRCTPFRTPGESVPTCLAFCRQCSNATWASGLTLYWHKQATANRHLPVATLCHWQAFAASVVHAQGLQASTSPKQACPPCLLACLQHCNSTVTEGTEQGSPLHLLTSSPMAPVA